MNNDDLADQLVSGAPDDPLPDPLLANPLDLQIALHRIVTGTMRSNLARAKQAAARSRQIAHRYPDDPLLDAQAHWSEGSATLYQPDYAGALAHYDAALDAYARACAMLDPAEPAIDVRVVEVVRVFCLNELGRYSEALAASDAAEEWLRVRSEPAASLALRVNQSLLAGNMGDYGSMYHLADTVVTLATIRDSSATRAMGWINKANACIALGTFAEAEVSLAHGLADAERAGESLTVARALVNRAWLRRCQGRLAESLADLRVAAVGLAQAPGEAATVALETSAVYAQLRQLHDALRQARHAASSFRAQQMPLYSATAELEASRICIRLGDAARAARHLATAADDAAFLNQQTVTDELTVTAARIAALPHATKGGIRAARSNAAAAAERMAAAGLSHEAVVAQLAVAALDVRLGRRTCARATYTALADHSNIEVRLEALTGLANLLALDQVLPYLREAAALATTFRRTLPAEELQARYASETSIYHTRLAHAFSQSGMHEAALAAIWEAKAGPILDLRASAGQIDPIAQDRIDAARIVLARVRSQLREHREKAAEAAQAAQWERVAYHQHAMTEATAVVNEAELALTLIAREHSDRTGQTYVPAPARLAAQLPHDMVVLEYAHLDDELVCFVARPQAAPICRSLGKYASLVEIIAHFDLIRHSGQGVQYAAATTRRRQSVLSALSDRLIAPLADLIGEADRLLIAPVDTLYHVPWAALPYAGADLIDHVVPVLTPCGALWAAESPPAHPVPDPPRFLGYSGAGDRHLPGVVAELTVSASMLPGAVVINPASSSDLRRGPPPRILHIAAHGVTRPDAPMTSSIDLADGPFVLLEAHRLNLRGTDLVVLSACDTSERPEYGEMALAIAGAFLCAGARTVIASLWAVDDGATADLMGRFYAEISRGEPSETALRNAQRHLRAANVHDWAAFQLWVGASSA